MSLRPLFRPPQPSLLSSASVGKIFSSSLPGFPSAEIRPTRVHPHQVLFHSQHLCGTFLPIVKSLLLTKVHLSVGPWLPGLLRTTSPSIPSLCLTRFLSVVSFLPGYAPAPGFRPSPSLTFPQRQTLWKKNSAFTFFCLVRSTLGLLPPCLLLYFPTEKTLSMLTNGLLGAPNPKRTLDVLLHLPQNSTRVYYPTTWGVGSGFIKSCQT